MPPISRHDDGRGVEPWQLRVVHPAKRKLTLHLRYGGESEQTPSPGVRRTVNRVEGKPGEGEDVFRKEGGRGPFAPDDLTGVRSEPPSVRGRVDPRGSA